ncbi:MAG: hypothetical protein LUD74_02440 [Tannerellaceae bacterium]|nr:hypothetical protein [Tannerellaceae bacterium]
MRQPAMRNFKQKLTHLFWPGMWLMFLVIAVYSAIRWLLDFKLHLVTLEQVWLDYWIPMAFIAFCVWIFVDYRIAPFVDFEVTKDKRYNEYQGYLVITFCILLWGVSSSQKLLSLVSGKAIVTSHIAEAGQLHVNDRLVIKDFAPLEGSAASYTQRRYIRKSGSRYAYINYFVICLGSSAHQQFWYGIRYYGGRLNHADPQAYRDSVEHQLYKQHLERFEQQLTQTPIFLTPVFDVVEQNQFIEAIQNSALKSRNNIVILSPAKRTYKEEVYRQLRKTLSSIGLALLVYLIYVLQVKLTPQAGKE